MLSPRWRKVWREIALHRARSLLVVGAVAVGLIGAGTVLNTWALVQRATELGYRASLPASATLTIEGIDAALLEQVRALPEVAAVRARRSAVAVVQSSGAWRNALLVAMDDFTDTTIARLQPDSGSWPPRDGMVVIERSSLDFSGARVGEPMLIKLGTAAPVPLPVGGVLRDVSLAPGWMEHQVTGYATPETLAQLGAGGSFNELQIRVRDGGASRAEVRRVAAAVKALAEGRGARVGAVDVPEPGQHIHAAQMESLLLTQGAFGLLALAVCAFLVINLVTAMLAGQTREIAVMKVLGASPAQVAALTLGHALLLGLAASLIALPVAVALGRQYAAFKGELLNFPVTPYAIPWWAIALQLAVGALLPVVAAAWPVRRACRMPVGEALRDIGIVAPGGALHARRWLRLRGAALVGSRPLWLSVGNAFRRRQRLLLTLLALAAGGAVYLGAANLREAVRGSVDLLYAGQDFDVTLRLAEPQPAAALEAAAAAVDGIERAQAWRGQRATLAQADGSAGERFTLLGLPAASTLLRPRLVSGRWLADSDVDALVLSQRLLKQNAGVVSGGEVPLTIDGMSRAWRVVGVVDAGPQAIAYTTRSQLDRLHGNTLAGTLAVATRARSAGLQLETIQRLRSELALAGMPVAASQLQAEGRRVLEDHLLMVVDFLGAMAWVMIVVGGMGLSSTISLGVLERTREIGVMRAIGARHGAVMAIVQAEGLVIVVLAWLASLPLSVPMSVGLAEAFGRVMFALPTPVAPGAGAALRWLALMVVISLLACAWPAWRAARVPAARALSYE